MATPRAPAIGLLGQHLLCLAFTCVRILLIEPLPSMGLGLVLVFNFFGGLGGMAIVTAAWGIRHIVAGMALSTLWMRRPALRPAAA